MGGLLDALTKKQQKPKGFRYRPRYYNADKAEFTAYVEKLRRERDARDLGEYRPDFKGKFRSTARKGSAYQKQIAMYNLRLLLMLTGICILAYYLFSTGAIGKGLGKFYEIFNKKDGLY